MGWSDRAVSPAIWTPETADAGGMSLSTGLALTDGRLGKKNECPYFRDILIFEFLPSAYASGSIPNGGTLGGTLAEANASYQPTLKTSVESALYLEFDGTNDRLTTSATASAGTLTAFVAFKMRDAAMNGYAPIFTGPNGNHKMIADSNGVSLYSSAGGNSRTNGVATENLVGGGRNLTSCIFASPGTVMELSGTVGLSRFSKLDVFGVWVFAVSMTAQNRAIVESWINSYCGWSVLP